jgi:hypothetical protein
MVNTRTKVFSFPHSRFIGFDHVWDEIERLTAAGANEKGFPRHNIIKYSEGSDGPSTPKDQVILDASG